MGETFQQPAPTCPHCGHAMNTDEMLKHALWLASSFTVHRYLMSNAEGRWSGAEKVTCHDELCCLYVAVFRGAEVDRVRVDFEADWVAVHDATQELTDHMDVVIGFPLKGVPDYEALAPKFFAYFHRLAAHALRASRGQAPAGATEEVENLRKALVYAAFALHDTPQYMLAQGIALIDGDTVRVSRDGWTVEASVNPHRQPPPAPPPECETEAEKRAFAFGWFKALESERMKADNKKKDQL